MGDWEFFEFDLVPEGTEAVSALIDAPDPPTMVQRLVPGGTGLVLDDPVVTVVSARKNRGGRPPVMTKDVRKRYVAELAAGRRPGIAAANVGVSTKSVQRYQATHPKFAAKCHRAIAGSVEHLEDAAWKAATEDRNPTMLIFMLANLASDRFKRDPDKAVLAQINVGASVEWSLQDARTRLHQMADELEARRQQKSLEAEGGAIDVESREASGDG